MQLRVDETCDSTVATSAESSPTSAEQTEHLSGIRKDSPKRPSTPSFFVCRCVSYHGKVPKGLRVQCWHQFNESVVPGSRSNQSRLRRAWYLGGSWGLVSRVISTLTGAISNYTLNYTQSFQGPDWVLAWGVQGRNYKVLGCIGISIVTIWVVVKIMVPFWVPTRSLL